MSFGAAELFIDLMRVHYVVAVGAPWCCLEIGRTIEMADTKVRQVIRDRGGVGKPKACVQLDAVSGTEVSGHGGALSVIVTQRELPGRLFAAAPPFPALIGQYPTPPATHRPNHVWEG
jgi:hypothetical protein